MILLRDAKIGELIRHKGNIDVWIVVGKNTVGLQIVNLSIRQDPAEIKMLLPAYAEMWELDVNLKDPERWEKEDIPVHSGLTGDDKLEEEEADDRFTALSY